VRKSLLVSATILNDIAMQVDKSGLEYYRFWYFRFRYSFICQDTSTRRQRSDLYGLRIQLPPVTTSLTSSKVEAIPLSALRKDATSELAGVTPQSTLTLFKC